MYADARLQGNARGRDGAGVFCALLKYRPLTPLTRVIAGNKESTVFTKIRLAALAAALVVVATRIANAECGTRGGPGLRGSDGKCQSWESVGRVCGSGACTRERVNPNADDAIAKGLGIKRYRDEAHRKVGP